ncbi:MAG TPA: hypothetical protein VLX92_12490 [Kofleriaceae bacterium]|nr:hypothetical protein [Kofleriaceae bacterium]
MTILSARGFDWFITAVVGGTAAAWLVYDAINLARARRADRRDPIVRDRHFGYVMGMIIGLIGVIGVLRHHLG